MLQVSLRVGLDSALDTCEITSQCRPQLAELNLKALDALVHRCHEVAVRQWLIQQIAHGCVPPIGGGSPALYPAQRIQR
jgi:hypothetical protein